MKRFNPESIIPDKKPTVADLWHKTKIQLKSVINKEKCVHSIVKNVKNGYQRVMSENMIAPQILDLIINKNNYFIISFYIMSNKNEKYILFYIYIFISYNILLLIYW